MDSHTLLGPVQEPFLGVKVSLIVFVWLPRIQAPPPRSLQALLERQWEQTAQFILDQAQAGKQNSGEQVKPIDR